MMITTAKTCRGRIEETVETTARSAQQHQQTDQSDEQNQTDDQIDQIGIEESSGHVHWLIEHPT